MSDVMSDRRTALRYPIVLVAEVFHLSTGLKINARSSDLSLTGCYIDTLSPVPRGTGVRVRLTRSSEVFDATGKVAYVSPGLGMGVMFDQPLMPTQLALLERWFMDAARNAG